MGREDPIEQFLAGFGNLRIGDSSVIGAFDPLQIALLLQFVHGIGDAPAGDEDLVANRLKRRPALVVEQFQYAEFGCGQSIALHVLHRTIHDDLIGFGQDDE